MNWNRIILVVILAVALLAATACIKSRGDIGKGPSLKHKSPVRTAFYEDDRVAVYRDGLKTDVLDKETGQMIKAGYSNAVETIKHKPADVPPLVGVMLNEGLRLVNDDEIYIFETRPRFRQLSVYPNPGTTGDKIIISKKTNTLYFYSNGELYKTFPVATGKDPRYTPEGRFKVANKVEDRRDELKEQLGVCWMGLSVPCEKDNRADGDDRAPAGNKYGIHGTNEPDSIGRYASGGCIRMSNEQARELFAIVKVGTPVEIR